MPLSLFAFNKGCHFGYGKEVAVGGGGGRLEQRTVMRMQMPVGGGGWL